MIDILINRKEDKKTLPAIADSVNGKNLLGQMLSPLGIKRLAGLEIALGAHADVLHIVFQIDGDLLALKDELPIDLAAVAGGLAPAGADGLHLLNGVGQLQQTGGAGETLEGEV